MRLIITGNPGSGKTTFCLKLVDYFSSKGLKAGGMVTKEFRDSNGNRLGFEVKNIITNEEGILAKKGFASEKKVGEYGVNLKDLERIGVGAIDFAIKSCDLIVIDEIGHMECYSELFRNKYREAFDSGKHVIATVHHRFAPAFSQGEWRKKIDYILDISKQDSNRCFELVQVMFGKIRK